MKEVPIDRKRNICFVGHNGSGKTSLLEAALYFKGALERLGRPEDGTTFSDYTDEEKRRHVSIHTAIANFIHKGHRVTILDLPGYADFIGEVRGGMRVTDGAVLVISADSGVQVETEKAALFADEFDIPVLAIVNKMDRENADFDKAVASMKERLSKPIVPLQIPIGKEADFKGVVDIINLKAITFDAKGAVASTGDVPADLLDQVNEYRENLMDTAAEQDEAVMEKYLEGTELTDQEIINGLAMGMASGTFIPVFCGSATKCLGIETFLDAIVGLLPSPLRKSEFPVKNAKGEEKSVKVDPDGETVAYIWRTAIDPYAGRLSYFRVYSGSLSADNLYNTTKRSNEKVSGILEVNGKATKAVTRATAGDIGAFAKMENARTGDTFSAQATGYLLEPTEYPPFQIRRVFVPEAKADEEKMGAALSRLVEEDPTLKSERNPETNELIISGTGDLHLEVVRERLKNQFGVAVDLKVPKVAYRETVTLKNEGSYRHKKQSGGRGQFGEVHLRIEPNQTGAGFEFLDEIVGGVIPARFVPAVEKGVVERMKRGILAGYPVVDVKVALFYGKTHDVDSSEMAFKIAGSMGFKEIAARCKPILLEPIMNIEVIIPEEYMGDVIGDLNGKRGRILGMDPHDGVQHVKAQIPEAEIHSYCQDLRSIARGRGMFKMEFSHYEQVPSDTAEKIIAGAQLDEDEE